MIGISPTIYTGRVIITFSVTTGSIPQDIHFNIGVNRTAVIIITARNIVFIDKIMQNSIDSLSHLLFGRGLRWGHRNTRFLLQFTVGPKYNEPPHYEPRDKKHHRKSYTERSNVYEGGGFSDKQPRQVQLDCTHDCSTHGPGTCWSHLSLVLMTREIPHCRDNRRKQEIQEGGARH